uniref:Calnexin n=1 Tax=Plectus sambesii TaxID=2011161 RepID=A0A914UUV6_9BILA
MRLWLTLGICCVLLLSRTVSAIDGTEEETGENFDSDIKKTAPPSGSKTIGDDFDDDEAAMGDDDDMMPPMGDMGGDEEPESAKPLEPLDYTTPMPQGFYFFADPFLDTKGIGKRWHVSTAKKEDTDETIAKYNGEWEIGLPENVALKNDYGLIVKSKARHHAIAAKLDRPVQFDGKPLIVQYEAKYQNGQECGGGYIKLLSKGAEKDLKNFQDKTPYSIMFGPDKCGMTSKVHFIIRYENPKNHTISEYHAKHTSKSLDEYFNDHKTHLYTLVINPDNTYQILVDQREITSGNLLKDLEPSLTPPKEVDDPEDKKPEDWDDREKIVDPEAKKPEDWDEDAPKEIEDPSATKPADWLDDEEDLIADPEATKPDDWDTEMDGEWEAPRIKNTKCEGVSGCGEWNAPKIANPAYKGKWKAPKITNPNFKGHWSPRRIDNPHYFEPEPYKMTPITAVGIELWTMSEGILFDNFLMTDDKLVADNFAG